MKLQSISLHHDLPYQTYILILRKAGSSRDFRPYCNCPIPALDHRTWPTEWRWMKQLLDAVGCCWLRLWHLVTLQTAFATLLTSLLKSLQTSKREHLWVWSLRRDHNFEHLWTWYIHYVLYVLVVWRCWFSIVSRSVREITSLVQYQLHNLLNLLSLFWTGAGVIHPCGIWSWNYLLNFVSRQPTHKPPQMSQRTGWNPK